MNIDIERRNINAKLADPTFVSALEDFIKKIEFDGDFEVKERFGNWASFGLAYDDNEIIELLNASQESLESIIDKFYRAHGSNYASAREFLYVLKDTLRVNVISRIQQHRTSSPSNVLNDDDPAFDMSILDHETDKLPLEQKRQILLSYLELPPTYHKDYVDQYIIANEIATASPERLQTFLDNLKLRKKEMIINLRRSIADMKDRLARGDFQWKRQRFEFEQRIADNERLLQYYTTVNNLEVFIPLSSHSSLGQGNSLVAEFVEKHIDTSVFDAEIKRLQTLNNLIESIDKGLVAEDSYFNGSSIISRSTSARVYNDEMDISEFVAQIPTFSREMQTNFAYNPGMVEKLLSDKKIPIKGFKRTNENGSQDEFYLYSNNEFGTIERMIAPLFLKHIQRDAARGTFSAMFYVFEGPDIRFGTQLFRIDKVPEMYRNRPSSHRQASGDVLVTNVHVHGYDLFDRVLINTNRPSELGHSDISTNFTTDSQLGDNILELFVDQRCNIEREFFDFMMEEIRVQEQQSNAQEEENGRNY